MPSHNEPSAIRTVSVIGAGQMGRGIAAATVAAGLRVKIADVDEASAQAAVDKILLPRQAPPVGALHPGEESSRRCISIARSPAQIAEADLIVEAVAEDAAIKRDVLARIEPYVCDDTIVASNSSSLPIGQLARFWKQPGRFCGLHFCHPVQRRPLVEVVLAETTTNETIERAVRFARSIGKSPIVVGDRPGFLLNRLLVPYMNESLELLLEGVDVRLLDQAAARFGMPIGPLAHFDEFGIDVALAVGRTLFRSFPDRIVPSELLVALYKAGRLGRKSGGGFYDAQSDAGAAQLAPPVQEMLRERQRQRASYTVEQVTRRLFLPMLLEATRALDESLVETPSVVDRALRDGLAMIHPAGGLLAWAETVGAPTILQWLSALEPLGKRYEPTQLLLNAAAGQTRLLNRYENAA